MGEYEKRREITKKIAGIIPTSEDEKSRLLMSEYLLTQEEAEQFLRNQEKGYPTREDYYSAVDEHYKEILLDAIEHNLRNAMWEGQQMKAFNRWSDTRDREEFIRLSLMLFPDVDQQKAEKWADELGYV